MDIVENDDIRKLLYKLDPQEYSQVMRYIRFLLFSRDMQEKKDDHKEKKRIAYERLEAFKKQSQSIFPKHIDIEEIKGEAIQAKYDSVN